MEQPDNISQNKQRICLSKTVFVLTASTGFLGQYLLRRLAEDPQVDKIHCVAVRDSQNRQSLFDFEKAVVHQGDLALPRLGLSEETATAIFAEADVVIHNGADVSHLKSYKTLRPANVNSTKELAGLCLDRTIPIHYVSTVGTAMFIPRESFGEVSVSSTLPPNNGSDGYTSSKCASERYLERVNEHHGLPIWIHRPSSITRSSSLLGEDASEMELLQNLLKYSRVIKATPASPRLKGALDLVTAENVADGIVKSALENRIQPTVTYVHQTGDFLSSHHGHEGVPRKRRRIRRWKRCLWLSGPIEPLRQVCTLPLVPRSGKWRICMKAQMGVSRICERRNRREMIRPLIQPRLELSLASGPSRQVVYVDSLRSTPKAGPAYGEGVGSQYKKNHR